MKRAPLLVIRGEPERAPNTRQIHEKPEAVYIFVSDLAGQRPNAHAQIQRVFVRT